MATQIYLLASYFSCEADLDTIGRRGGLQRMLERRAVLEPLKRNELIELLDALELEVDDRRVRGFLALAWECDHTGEGTRVSTADCGIKLWVDGKIDGQPNGLMDPGELIETSEWGITELDFNYRYRPGFIDRHGNAGRFVSRIGPRVTIDVFFWKRELE